MSQLNDEEILMFDNYNTVTLHNSCEIDILNVQTGEWRKANQKTTLYSESTERITFFFDRKLFVFLGSDEDKDGG